MFEHLEKIRVRPEKEKKRLAFLVSFLFTLLVLILWYFSVFPNFKEQSVIDKKIEYIEAGPANSFASVFGDKFREVKKAVSEINKITTLFSDNSAYYISTSTPVTTTTISTTSEQKIEEIEEIIE